MEIKYVVMPITVEQKRAFNREGFRVVDARFAPDGTDIENPTDNGDDDKARKAAERKAAREARKAAGGKADDSEE